VPVRRALTCWLSQFTRHPKVLPEKSKMLVVAASPNSALEAFGEEQVECLRVTVEVNVATSIS